MAGPILLPDHEFKEIPGSSARFCHACNQLGFRSYGLTALIARRINKAHNTAKRMTKLNRMPPLADLEMVFEIISSEVEGRTEPAKIARYVRDGGQNPFEKTSSGKTPPKEEMVRMYAIIVFSEICAQCGLEISLLGSFVQTAVDQLVKTCKKDDLKTPPEMRANETFKAIADALINAWIDQNEQTVKAVSETRATQTLN